MKHMLAIIGGSSLDQLAALEGVKRVEVATPYGKPSGPLVFGRLNQRDVIFLARHGERHQIAPHRINYRANIWALHAQGIVQTISVATVGGIGSDWHAGALGVPDQIIDCTWGRASTFFDGEGDGTVSPVKHIDFTQPYDSSVRSDILKCARRVGIPLVDGGTYAATQGPRLETAAEIQRLARDGAHMVGMTGMPEAALARELGLRYGCLAVVVNAAAGLGASADGIDLSMAETLGREAMTRVVRILMELAADGD